ncbi:MAG: hemolysin family protein [bacterium]|jgi:putative hemolysin
MLTLLIVSAVLSGFLLLLLTYVQVLYEESLRIRPRERPALDYFKESIQPRMGLENERGVLTFSLLKHTLLLVLGAVFAILGWQLSTNGSTWRIGESLIFAWLAMLGATYVMPHVLYRRTKGRWISWMVPLLRALAIAMKPLVGVFAFFQALSEFRDRDENKDEQTGPDADIDALICAGQEEGLIEESDRELIESVVAFGDTRVREVMTPRPNIVAIEASATLEDLRTLVINEQYSRIPVYEGTIDNIIGFVHVRDMFLIGESERRVRTVRSLLRTIRVIPETKLVHDLFKEMQADRAHIAIVVDEYGNTAGLVTMEDMVEEVFGEIRDEYEPGVDVTQDGNGGYIVSGNFGVDRLEELLGFRPNGDVESTTVGGLVMEWLGRVPLPGEAVERGGIRVQVLSSNELRIEKVRLSRVKQNGLEQPRHA